MSVTINVVCYKSVSIRLTTGIKPYIYNNSDCHYEPNRHYRGWCKVQSFPSSRAWLTETYRRQEARILANYRIKDNTYDDLHDFDDKGLSLQQETSTQPDAERCNNPVEQ